MIDREDARKIAMEYLCSRYPSRPEGDDVIIIETGVVEEECGWVFPFNSRRFIESGEFEAMLMSIAPIFVDRCAGQVHPLSPSETLDDGLKRIRASLRRPA